MRNSFFLVIPAQQKDSERIKKFEEKELKQWLSALPMANLALATRLFYDQLVEFNTLEMDMQQRLDGLEMLRSSFLLIEDYLRSRLTLQSFPKPENDRKIFNVLVSLEKELTIGYWMVIRSLNHRSVGWFQGKHYSLVIQRCIKGLSAIVVSHFIMRFAIPDWVWMDLHSLNRLAHRLKVHDTKVSERAKTSTPEESYCQILMLGLTKPVGLREKEVVQIYNFLEKFVGYIKFSDKAVKGMEKQCIVQADEDKPPFFQTEAMARELDSQLLYMDLEKFKRTLHQKSKLILGNEARFCSVTLNANDDDRLAPELLKYVEQRWDGEQLQGAVCVPDRLDRFIAVGLNSTHDLLMLDENTLSKQNTEFLVHSDSDRILTGLFDQSGVLSIGSLISFRKTDCSVTKRCLGMVNKIEIDKTGAKLSFELEVLTAHVFAVNYKMLNAKENSDSQKALLYGIKVDGNEKRYIIFESFMLKEGDVVRMYFGDEDFPILLTERKNVGLGYWQFACGRVDEMSAKKNQQQSQKGYDFI